jgi:hypothetical protein
MRQVVSCCQMNLRYSLNNELHLFQLNVIQDMQPELVKDWDSVGLGTLICFHFIVCSIE